MIVVDEPTLLDGLRRFVVVMCRLSALFFSAPILSASSVSVPIRIAISVALTLMLMAAVPVPDSLDPLSLSGVVLLLQEVLIGLTLGFALLVAFSAVALAGEQIAMSMGLSFAAMVDPQSGAQSPVLGQFLTALLIILFLALDGHLILIGKLAQSYDVVPVGTTVPSLDFVLSVAFSASLMFASAVVIMAPIVTGLLLANLTTGVLTRLAPQMNLFSVGFPIIVLVGIFLLFLALPGIGDALGDLVADVVDVIDEILFRLAGPEG